MFRACCRVDVIRGFNSFVFGLLVETFGYILVVHCTSNFLNFWVLDWCNSFEILLVCCYICFVSDSRFGERFVGFSTVLMSLLLLGVLRMIVGFEFRVVRGASGSFRMILCGD